MPACRGILAVVWLSPVGERDAVAIIPPSLLPCTWPRVRAFRYSR